MYRWSQLKDLYDESGRHAQLAVMHVDRLFVGRVADFVVKYGIVKIGFNVVVSEASNTIETLRINVAFDDRHHLLRSSPPNRFFTHGIDGLGGVVFTIIDTECMHQITLVEQPILRTGWSYALDEQDDRDGRQPARRHLNPVNPTS